jgi:hypothetical protein
MVEEEAKQGTSKSSACRCFLHGFLFDHDNGGGTFLENLG